MTVTSETSPDSVTAEINYHAGTTNNEPLFNITPRLHQYLPEGTPATNGVHEAKAVKIQSVLSVPHKFTLENHGFQLGSLDSAVNDWTDTEEIRKVYYPEIEKLLTQATGGSRVYVFDHVTRGILPKGKDNSAFASPNTPPPPVLRAHVDFSARSGPQRVRRFLGDDADQLLHGRYAIIQVWKPLRGPVIDAPLAVADAATVSPDDLEPSYLVYPDRVGETYQLKYNPNHRWYYYPGIQANQVYVFKCFDSKLNGTRFTPHTAFLDPTAPKDAPKRQSIEIRALVFWDKANEE